MSDMTKGFEKVTESILKTLPEGTVVNEVQDEIIFTVPQIEHPIMCDRDICIKNEYSGIGCEHCEVNEVTYERLNR